MYASTAAYLLSVSFALALCPIAYVSLKIWRCKKIGFFDTMGEASWDFSRSWGTNISIGGGILSALIQYGWLATESKNSYFSLLSVYFALIILLSPLIYTAGTINRKIDASEEPSIQGYVILFLVCTTLTAWGSFGQLLVLYFAADQALNLNADIILVGNLIKGVSLVSLVGLFFYLSRAAYWTIISQNLNRQRRQMSEQVTNTRWTLL